MQNNLDLVANLLCAGLIFLERLDIPQSYAVADIDKRILKQVIKDFNEPTVFNPNKPIFKNFKIEKSKEEAEADQ